MAAEESRKRDRVARGAARAALSGALIYGSIVVIGTALIVWALFSL